jgi:predicted phosphoadenosine phosphosulfate sulfurtransferase
MVLVQRELEQDVVSAANERIKNIFANKLPVYLSLSGGKDSITLANLVYELCASGEVDKSLLVVDFIDEEAVFDDVEQIVREWRQKFMLLGIPFRWWCIEVKHFNCFNQLTNDESFICWDRRAKDNWVRQMPDFALTEHPKLKVREETYQDFLTRICRDGISMVGLRTAESVQRLYAVSMSKNDQKLFPIYDWKDTDVWRYIRDKNLNYPIVYEYLYQTGGNKRDMRISQFFSIDTSRVLVKMSEFYPQLMEKIVAREPNAYLAALYWDSELFRRGKPTKQAKAGEEIEDDTIDWKAKVLEFISDPENLDGKVRIKNTVRVRQLMIKFQNDILPKDYKRLYEVLVAGDPKERTLRAITLSLRKNDWERNIADGDRRAI